LHCSVIHPAFNNIPVISNSAISGELWCDAGWHPSI